MEKEIEKTETKIKYETCVLCHRNLNLPVDTQIDYRPYYVEGAGQLCYDCYHKIYSL